MLAAAVALAGAAAARAGEPVNVNWPSYLPALPGPNRPQPHAVPHCRTATVHCIDVEIQRPLGGQPRGPYGPTGAGTYYTGPLVVMENISEVFEKRIPCRQDVNL